ncbi:MAG: anion permease [Vicinamibacterales bacterium]
MALLALFHLAPAPEPITPIGMGRLGLLAFAIVWWICAPFPLAVPTIAALGLGVGTGVLSLDDAFAASTSWVVWFAVGAFGLSAALEVNGFNRRFALWFVNLRWLRGRPFALLFMFLLSAALMSAVMSNTVVSVGGSRSPRRYTRHSACAPRSIPRDQHPRHCVAVEHRRHHDADWHARERRDDWHGRCRYRV